MLTITNIKSEDKGEYSVRVNDETVDNLTSSCILDVKGMPI